VEEYWILFPAEKNAEIHRRPQNGKYLDREVIEGDSVAQCARLSDMSVRLSDLFG